MTTDKLLRRPRPVEITSSFLYVSAADICGCKKDEWVSFIEKTAAEAKPDFVFFADADTAEKVNVSCRKVTAENAPLFVAVNGVNYAVILDKNNDEIAEKNNVRACVYGNDKKDYAVSKDGVWYLNTASSSNGGIRKVALQADGQLVSDMVYFVDKRELLYKTNWKTVLLSRGTSGRPLSDGDYVYIPTADDGMPKKSGIYKLEGRGGLIWKFDTENTVDCDLAEYGDTVVAVDCEARVYFISKESAKLLNSIRLPFDGKCADLALTYFGRMAYISLNGTVYAINMAEQTLAWEYTAAEGQAARKPVIAGKLLICGGENGLYALCTKTGVKVWENTEIKACASALPLVSGRILLPTDDALLILDGETGRVVSGKKIPDTDFNVPSQPLLRGGVVYVGTKGKGVVAVDMSDVIRAEEPSDILEAEITASYPVDGGKKTVVGDMTYLDSHIVFATADGFTYMTNLLTGENKKCLDTLSAVNAAPSFVRLKKPGRNAMEGFIVTSTLSGKIFGNKL